MRAYLRLEILRTLRDPMFLCLAVIAPIGFYLLFTALFGAQPPAPGQLSSILVQMVAMSVYGGMWACLLATGPRIAVERANGWIRNLNLLPIAPTATLIARLIASALFALSAILLVCGTAVIAHGNHLSAGTWVAVIGLCWLGVWPFALLGIAIGYAVNAEAAFGVTYGLYTALAALGGLWVPLTLFPVSIADHRQNAAVLSGCRVGLACGEWSGSHRDERDDAHSLVRTLCPADRRVHAAPLAEPHGVRLGETSRAVYRIGEPLS